MGFSPKKLPARTGQDDGGAPRVKPANLVGNLILVKVNEIKDGVVTKHSGPDGSKAAIVDVVSVETGSAAFDQMWFNPGVVDNIEGSLGDIVSGRIQWATSAKGNAYLVIEETGDDDDVAVAAFAEANPNAFVKSDATGPAPAATPTQTPAASAPPATAEPAVSQAPAAAAPSRW